MQNNSNIEISFDTLKNDVLDVLEDVSKKNRDAFVNCVKLFVKKNDWFQVNEIESFIKKHNKIFSNGEVGEVLFRVLKFFLDTALMQNYDIKVDNVHNLLNEFQDKLSWEQSCGLLIGFLDKDWDRNQNNKNPENAKKIVDNLLSYLEKSEAKKIYKDKSKFGCVKKYFTKIMTDVPAIKTSEYLSQISKKLAETNLTPQFCFEVVLSFGDEILLKTDVKNLGWHAQFAQFRLKFVNIAKEKCQNVSANKNKDIFAADIHLSTELMKFKYFQSALDELAEWLNNENVSWKTRFGITNYLHFESYHDKIINEGDKKTPKLCDVLRKWKSVTRKKFQSPNDLLDVYAEVFPDLKYQDEFFVTWRSGGSDLFYVLCLVYSRKEIYQCIKSLNNINDNTWKSKFLWEVTASYRRDLPESEVAITDFFKTPGEFLDDFLKSYPEINEFNAKLIADASLNISIADLFSYHIDDIKSFIEKTDDPKKLVLLFYVIFDGWGCEAQSPLVALDIYIKLCPKIKDHLKDTNEIVCKSLSKGFKIDSLVGALRETDDPEKMILLLNTLNQYKYYDEIKKIFKDPKDLFDICVSKYKSKENNFEINENNCRCPEPLLKILKEYGKRKLAGFTEAFKNENDPLTKSWLLDLVNVKRNFFETYRNVLDFLDKNENCPQCVKNNLNRIINKKCDSGFSKYDGLWLFGLEKDYHFRAINHNKLMYLPENIIEKRYQLILNLFSNSNEHGRAVISRFIKDASKFHESIWKAVLGLIIYAGEREQDIKDKNINLWQMLKTLCSKVDEYNQYKKTYDRLSSQISNLNNQINQILTLNWKWFTIIWTFVSLYQLYQAKKSLNNSIAEKNWLQPFVKRLEQANEKFGLQANDRDQNKPTPFKYYEKYQTCVEKLLDDMKKIMAPPEKEKILNENKANEEINNNLNIISTASDNQEEKIGGIGD